MTGELDVAGLAEVLAGHGYEMAMRRGSICACGFVPTVDPDSLRTQQDYHRDHLAAVVMSEIRPTLAAAEIEAEQWKRTCVTRSEEYALIWKVGREVSEVLANGPDTWTPYDSRDTGQTFLAESVLDFTAELRAALDRGDGSAS